MANADVAHNAHGLLVEPDEAVVRRPDIPNITPNTQANHSGPLLGPFATFNDALTDNMFDLLLQQHPEFKRSPSPFQTHDRAPHRQQIWRMSPEVIDLADDGPVTAVRSGRSPVQENPLAPALTEDKCLMQVLQILPDISHDHVLQLFKSAPPTPADGHDWIQAFIGNILEDSNYPKQKDSLRGTKRKREALEEEEWKQYENAEPGDFEDMYKLCG